ncbi:MAG: N-acetylglucosamine-6-phosphate deacetylase [bacterium]
MGEVLAITNGRVVTPKGVLDHGAVLISERRIESVTESRMADDSGVETVDAKGNWILPGLIDLHVMGGFDKCTFDPDPGVVTALARGLPKCGITAFLPATTTFQGSTEPISQLAAQIHEWDEVGACPLGLLVEGPFINPERRGGFTLSRVEDPSPERFEAILEACDDFLRIMMLAPERCLGGDYIERIASQGVVAMGHCQPTSQEAHEAVRRGVRYATHVFNAMGPLGHREPGVAGVSLVADEVVCELICDGRHVVREVVDLVARAKGPDGIALVTDSLPWLGLPPGEYDRWNLRVISDGETVKQENGTLIGTVLPLHLALRRFMEFTRWPLEKAISCVTSTPARVVGLYHERGSLEPGKRADILVLTPDFDVFGVWVGGERVV